MLGRPFCLRSLSCPLSLLSWERERDLQRRSLERERECLCLTLCERDEDLDLLLLGDLKHSQEIAAVTLHTLGSSREDSKVSHKDEDSKYKTNTAYVHQYNN